MKRLILLAALLLAAPALAQDADPPTPGSVVDAAKPDEWRAIDPADLLVMTLAPAADGSPRQVVIQLMPAPFSQGWVGNIRTLAKAHWWDGTSVYRVVDNWVAQWGDGEDDEAKAKPLPAGITVVPEENYSVGTETITSDLFNLALFLATRRVEDLRQTLEELPSDAAIDWDSVELPDPGGDSYVLSTGFSRGWPIGWNTRSAWPTHCYGTVGVARNLSPNTGTGAELYAVIGQAPRQLDRNIAVVGRVIEGIENLSTLPRGKGDAGVYDDPKLRAPIVSVRVGNELPEPPRFEYLASDSASFAEYVRVRANRNDAFYKVAAGGVDVCNVQVPIRRAAAK